MTSASLRGSSTTPIAVRKKRGGRGRDQPEQEPHRHEQQQRIVEVGGRERPGRPLRSATSRSDSRISALKAASIAPR